MDMAFMYGTWCLWYNDVRVYSYIYIQGAVVVVIAW